MQADCSRKFFQCLLNSKLAMPSQASPLIEQLEMTFPAVQDHTNQLKQCTINFRGNQKMYIDNIGDFLFKFPRYKTQQNMRTLALPGRSSMVARQNAGIINTIQTYTGNLNNCLVLPNTRIKSRLEIHITCLNTVNGREGPGDHRVIAACIHPYKQVTNHPFCSHVSVQ